ncbi:GNAT family N-acetyltransferase [Micromonospora sp. NBC_01813]|uniref:GNAT family N-acetyltransferase n=1 Tax=Micromonospora sp. NBC_01813 TaxID=2975988 RepID=UPI002DDA2747|nr:GNAT family N-acyltransferase [Micromonospora sp. NBC_01813]WSA12209.1 GNAT family N-acetyltransferase [Micromonospora sp. NBC_01813]
MAVLLTAATPVRTSEYTVSVAENADQVAAAQRLRHQVFTAEFGARPAGANPPGSRPPRSHLPGSRPLGEPAQRDVDEFDDHCDHLIVRHTRTGAVVGTYRLLPPARAARLGRRYADTEFDTRSLHLLADHLVEAGRSCVHPDHRGGAVINLIWAGIARYLQVRNLRWLGGCASVSLSDGGVAAHEVWREVRDAHLSPPLLRVRPRRPWLAEPSAIRTSEHQWASTGRRRAAMPPLLRGYLRLGAWVCGEPAYDPDFAVADLYVLLSLDRIDPRYLRHFLELR